jgi:hypothetical protein
MRCRVPGNQGTVTVLPRAGIGAIPAQSMSARDPGGDDRLTSARWPADPQHASERLHVDIS